MRSLAFAFALSVAGLAVGRTGEASELRGRITAAGRPVSAAQVQAFATESSLQAARREAQETPAPAALASTLSRSDGAFVLALPAQASAVSLRVEAPGFVAVRVEARAEGGDLGEVALRPSATLAGRVADGRGQPVAGATISVEPGRALFAGDDWVPEPLIARAGADGAFLVPGVAESQNRLRVEAPGFASAGLVGVRAGRLVSPLVLSPAVPLAGRVL
ncbi:MAG TPA: carboxypeptidase-like regulatory domain-containing protein, partial [Vicinamibacteria bacterium]